MSGAFKKIGAAVATGFAVQKVVAFGKAIISSYAEYEQLVGGVDTLFKNSSDKVQQYAANAYKTAGMSANKYMDTVTSFSASLLQGLGGDTEKAADVANLAITDMSDNANKMGTSMESIQNAYQGFAKQNYTMLDNLKLGYGGTQSEMVRLINDSGVLNEKISSMDGISFDTIISAIHSVQTEMGITGTTAKEASTTIEGSVNSLKGAWQNLLTGLAAGNQDLTPLLKNLLDSIVAVGKNVLPRIVTIFSSLGKLIVDNLSNGVIKNLPKLLDKGGELILKLANKFQEGFPKFVSKGMDLIINLTKGILNGLPKLLAKAPEIISKFIAGLAKYDGKLTAKGAEFIKVLVKGIAQAVPALIKAVGEIGINLVKGLWNGISNAKDWVFEKIRGFGADILDGIKSIFQIHSPSKATEEDGKMLALGLVSGIQKNQKYAKKSAEEMAELVLAAAEKRLDRLKTYNRISLEGEVEYWNEIRKQFKRGTDERLEADKKYYEAKNSLREKEKELENQRITDAETALQKEKRIRDVSAAEEAAYWAAIVQQTRKGSEARKAAEDKYYASLESYKQQFDDYVNHIMNQTSLFEAFTLPEEAVTGSQLIDNLASQVGGLESYYATLDSLQNRIGGTRLMSKLQEMGTDSLAELQAINNMTDEQLEQYVNLYDKKYNLAKEKATKALGDIETAVKKSMGNSNKKANFELQKMTDAVKTYTAKMLSTTQSKFSAIYSSISSNMAAALREVLDAVAAMNAALASAPTGGSKPTVKTPTTKKHAEGGILTRPTLFGFTPSTNTWHIGGEAGHEAIAPIDKLKGYVADAVASQNGELVAILEMILRAILDKDFKVYLNSKEISKAVNKDLGGVF